jgi:hypothetical protein
VAANAGFDAALYRFGVWGTSRSAAPSARRRSPSSPRSRSVGGGAYLGACRLLRVREFDVLLSLRSRPART